MKKKNKKIVAVGSAMLLVGAGLTGGILYNNYSADVEYLNNEISQLNNLTLEQTGVISDLKQNIVELENQEPQVITEYEEKIVEIPVDNGNLNTVLEHVYDADGNVEYLLDDLDDDETNLIVERIIKVNDLKTLAVKQVEKELFDELDKEEIVLNNDDTYEFDEDDLERLKVDDDFEDLIIEEIDFDDSDAEILVNFDFEDDDGLEFEGSCIVEFKNGEFEELKNIEVFQKE